jgi:hypothetical protein
MGMDSKTLEYPGVAEIFRGLRLIFRTKQDRDACPPQCSRNARQGMRQNDVPSLFFGR